MNKNLSFEILENLIRFRSITPKGMDALEYISNLLKEHGFIIDIQVFGQGESATGNLYAYKELNIFGGNLCFAGHVDVVSTGNISSWTSDPFELCIKDEKLYGRGVVDMKGSIAAFIAAMIEFLGSINDNTLVAKGGFASKVLEDSAAEEGIAVDVDKNKAIRGLELAPALIQSSNSSFCDLESGLYDRSNGLISFLLTTDEEGSGEFGTKEMLQYINNRYQAIDFCIVGEPTNEKRIGDMIKLGRRGSICFDLKIIGIQGHVAYPDLALNPVTIMLGILKELDSYKLDEGTEYFDPSNLEITSIDSGNRTNNIIPESISAKLNIRFNDRHSPESLVKLIEGVVKKYSSNYEIHHECSSLPFVQEYSNNMQKFSKVIECVTGITPTVSTSGGTSDARFISEYTEVIEFGLKSSLAHKIDEYCEKSDLQILEGVYYAYLIEFFRP